MKENFSGKEIGSGRFKRWLLNLLVNLFDEIEIAEKPSNRGCTKIDSESQSYRKEPKAEEAAPCIIQEENKEERKKEEHREKISRSYDDWRGLDSQRFNVGHEWLLSADKISNDDLDLYCDEAARLYHEFLELWIEEGYQNSDKIQQDFLLITPGYFRSHYERFELLVDMTDSEGIIKKELKEFSDNIFSRRQDVLNFLKEGSRETAVLIDHPLRKDSKKIDFQETIQKAKLALIVFKIYKKGVATAPYVASVLQNLEIFPSSVKLPCNLSAEERRGAMKKRDNQDKRLAKSVLAHHEHAEKLLESIPPGSFYATLPKPLSKNH